MTGKRKITRLAAILVATQWLHAAPAVAKDAPRGAEAAVRSVVQRVADGWSHGDAEVACSGYAPDADWINAFGIERRGSEEICVFIRKVIRNAARAAVRVTRDEIRSVIFPSPRVAVVHEYGEQIGQLGADGQPLGTRKTHWLVVLRKTGSQWLIVSHLVMDERAP